jgi:uncharacterized membrane protein
MASHNLGQVLFMTLFFVCFSVSLPIFAGVTIAKGMNTQTQTVWLFAFIGASIGIVMLSHTFARDQPSREEFEEAEARRKMMSDPRTFIQIPSHT